MKTITMTFSRGKVNIKTTGYKGAECLAATKAVEDALGVSADPAFTDVKTREYYQTATEQETHVKQQ